VARQRLVDVKIKGIGEDADENEEITEGCANGVNDVTVRIKRTDDNNERSD